MLRPTDDGFDIIVTIGPAILNGETLVALVKAGATIFRLNGAHNHVTSLPAIIGEIRAAVGDRARLMIDLPGRKVRTCNLPVPIRLVQDASFVLRQDQASDPSFLAGLKPGSVVIAADGLLRFSVERQVGDRTVFVSHCDGLLEVNRGLHASGAGSAGPFLGDDDRGLLVLADRNRVEYASVSFVRSAADLRECAEALPAGTPVRLVAKIETDEAYRNLDDILEVASHVLVDRGDLASAIGLDEIPAAQEVIVRRARARGRRVYLATQFLHSMVEHPIPLIAEVEAVAAAVRSGVTGLQLSEETAVGRYPVAAVTLVSTQAQRARERREVEGTVVWLLGLSGSGKTTLATRLQRALAEQYGIRAEVLDGDAVRASDQVPLGYSRADRTANIHRMIYLAKLLSRNGITTIVANISPYAELRSQARAELADYVEVYLDCPVEVCTRRDPKGLYARAARGEADHVIGVSEGFDPPGAPDLTVDTARTTEEEGLRRILDYLRNRVAPPRPGPA